MLIFSDFSSFVFTSLLLFFVVAATRGSTGKACLGRSATAAVCLLQDNGHCPWRCPWLAADGMTPAVFAEQTSSTLVFYTWNMPNYKVLARLTGYNYVL